MELLRTSPCLVVAASRVRKEERWIMDALDRRRLPYRYVDPRNAVAVLGGPAICSHMVLNREIGAIRAAYLAQMVECAGGTSLNSSAAIGRCSDKWKTSCCLVAAQVPTPRTALAFTPEAARKAFAEIGYPAVVKPALGSWGRRVCRVRDEEEATALLEYGADGHPPGGQLVYMQEYIDTAGRDIRVLVLVGQAVAACSRQSAQWRSNVALGASTSVCPLTGPVARLAIAAAAAVGAVLAGVDLIERPDGELLVLEVNHNVEFSGLQRAHGDTLIIADVIADFLDRSMP